MLHTNIAGIDLDCCIYNASGPRTGSIESLMKIGSSRSGAILSKSATKLGQEGNPTPRFINKIDLGGQLCQGSINSEGLPNKGIHYYTSQEAVDQLSVFKKPYIVSLSGLNLNDNLEMLAVTMQTSHVEAIELNLACPNVPGKPIIAYDFEQMNNVLREVTEHPQFSKKPLGVKLAPYFDLSYVKQAVSIIAKYPIKYIVTTNTIGNALFVDSENECAAIAPVFGGLGGGYVKQITLSNVRMITKVLEDVGRDDIDVVGVGGVATGKDAFELILCGAKAVQVGTCHWTEGPQCFDRIASELEEIMLKKGYKSIQEFRGKLKPYQKSKTNTNPGNIANAKDVNVSTSSKYVMHLLVAVIIILTAIILKLVIV